MKLTTAGHVAELLKDRADLRRSLIHRIAASQQSARFDHKAAERYGRMEAELAAVEANIKELRSLKLAQAVS